MCGNGTGEVEEKWTLVLEHSFFGNFLLLFFEGGELTLRIIKS